MSGKLCQAGRNSAQQELILFEVTANVVVLETWVRLCGSSTRPVS